MAYIQTPEEQKNKGMNVFGAEANTSQQANIEPTRQQMESSNIIQPAQMAPQGQSKTSGSGLFTNISKYIEANKPKTGQMAQSIVGKTQSQASDIGSALTQQKQELEAKLAPEQQRLQAAPQTIQTLLEQARSGTAPTTTPAPSANEAAKTTFYTPEQLTQINQLRTGTGNFQNINAPDYSQIAYKAQALQKLGQDIGTAPGTLQALKESFKAPTYTKGQTNLDQLLLQADPEAKKALIQGTQQATTGLGAKVTEAQKQDEATLGMIGQEAEKAKKATIEAVAAEQTALQKQLQDELDRQNKESAIQKIQRYFQGEVPETEEEKKAFREEILSLLNKDLARPTYTMNRPGTEDMGVVAGVEQNQLFGINPLATQFTGLDKNKMAVGQLEADINNIANIKQLREAQALAQLQGLTPEEQTLFTAPEQVGEQATYAQNEQAAIKALQAKILEARQNYANEMQAWENRYGPQLTNIENAIDNATNPNDVPWLQLEKAKLLRSQRAIQDKYNYGQVI